MWTKLLAGAGILALAGFFGWMHGNARYREGIAVQKVADAADTVKAEQRIADIRVAAEQRVTSAAGVYADKWAAREPLVVTNTKEVDNYAQTAAGRVLCRDPERVQYIDALDLSLFPAGSAASATGGSAPAVPAHASAATGGR